MKVLGFLICFLLSLSLSNGVWKLNTLSKIYLAEVNARPNVVKPTSIVRREGVPFVSGQPVWQTAEEIVRLRVDENAYPERPEAFYAVILIKGGGDELPGANIKFSGEGLMVQVNFSESVSARAACRFDKNGAVFSIDTGLLHSKVNAVMVTWHAGRKISLFLNGRILQFVDAEGGMPDGEEEVVVSARLAERIIEMEAGGYLPTFEYRYKLHSRWGDKYEEKFAVYPVLQHYGTIIHVEGATVRDPSEMLHIDGKYWVYFTLVRDPLIDGFKGSVWTSYCVDTDDPSVAENWSEPVEVIKQGDPKKDHDGTGCFTPDCYYDGKHVFLFYTGINSQHEKGLPGYKWPEHIMVAKSERPDGGFLKTEKHTPLTQETLGIGYDEATIPGGNELSYGKPAYDVSLIDHGQCWVMPDGERRYYYKGGGGSIPGGKGTVCIVRGLDENWLNGKRYEGNPILIDEQKRHMEGILITQVEDRLFLQMMIFDEKALRPWQTWTSDVNDGIFWDPLDDGYHLRPGHNYSSNGVYPTVNPLWGVGQFIEDIEGRRVVLGYCMIL